MLLKLLKLILKNYKLRKNWILGRRQMASQETLDLPFGGSNPPAPVG